MLFNQARARACMDDLGLDALIACTPVNITGFSDFTLWLDPLFREYMVQPGASGHRMQRYALFPRNGPPALVVEPMMAVNAADLWVRELVAFGAPTIEECAQAIDPEAWQGIRQVQARATHAASPTDALLQLLRRRGLQDARLGAELEELPAAHRQTLRTGLPQAQLRDCSNLLRYLRAVKTEDEIGRLRRAAEISEAAAMASLAGAAPGVSLQQLSRSYRAQVAQAGADFDHFALGIDGVGIASETAHRLADGAIMYVDFGCRWRSCYSDSGLTLALGPLSPALQRRYAALRACIDAGAAMLRPGLRASRAHAAMQRVIERSEISRCCAPWPWPRAGSARLSDYRGGQRPAPRGRLPRHPRRPAAGGEHGDQPRGQQLPRRRSLAAYRGDLPRHGGRAGAADPPAYCALPPGRGLRGANGNGARTGAAWPAQC